MERAASMFLTLEIQRLRYELNAVYSVLNFSGQSLYYIDQLLQYCPRRVDLYDYRQLLFAHMDQLHSTSILLNSIINFLYVALRYY